MRLKCNNRKLTALELLKPILLVTVIVLMILMFLLLFLLLTKNFLTENCNKLNEESPKSSSSSNNQEYYSQCQHHSENTNCTPVSEINKTINDNGSNTSSSCNNNVTNTPKNETPSLFTDCSTDCCCSFASSTNNKGVKILRHTTATPLPLSCSTNAVPHHKCNCVSSSSVRSFGVNIIGSQEDDRHKMARNRAKRFILFNGAGVVKLVLGISFPVPLADKQRSMAYLCNFHLQYTPPPRPIYWWSLFNTSTFAARQSHWIASQSTSSSSHVPNEGTTTALSSLQLTPKRMLSAIPAAKALPQVDKSRQFVYKAIEMIFERAGFPGTACLLKTMCDIVRLPFALHHLQRQKHQHSRAGVKAAANEVAAAAAAVDGNVFHALLNTIFIPPTPTPSTPTTFVNVVHAKYLNAHQAGLAGADCEQTFKECPKQMNWLQKFSHYI